MTERIRVRLFKAILGQEMSFFDKRSNGVGVLCAKLSADATSIQGVSLCDCTNCFSKVEDFIFIFSDYY